MTSRPPSFTKQRVHFHGHSFDSIYLKFGIWVVFLLLGLELLVSILRHQLQVKMTVEKTVKTGSDVNRKTKYWFWLILIRWSWIYAFLVHLIKNDRRNKDQTSEKTKIAHYFRTALVPNLFKQKKWKFPRGVTLKLGIQAFLFWLINIIDDVTGAIFYEKTRALSRPQFWSDLPEIWDLSSILHY